MVDDPYKVLGVSRDATKDEIKRAYRKKAKEYHPDIHPDDPKAAEKMNEVNEAYDMLNNPEKYQNRQRANSSGSQQTYGNPYGQQSYGNPYGQQNRNDEWEQWNQRGFQGGYWTFEDLFGYGYASRGPQKPQVEPGDTVEIQRAVEFLNRNQYEYANQILNQVVSVRRNARWYYLSSLAHAGLGNRLRASEQIQRAVQMEPQNQLYRQTMQYMSRTANTYNENGQEFHRYAQSMNNLCMGLCALQFFCMFCHC